MKSFFLIGVLTNADVDGSLSGNAFSAGAGSGLNLNQILSNSKSLLDAASALSQLSQATNSLTGANGIGSTLQSLTGSGIDLQSLMGSAPDLSALSSNIPNLSGLDLSGLVGQADLSKLLGGMANTGALPQLADLGSLGQMGDLSSLGDLSQFADLGKLTGALGDVDMKELLNVAGGLASSLSGGADSASSGSGLASGLGNLIPGSSSSSSNPVSMSGLTKAMIVNGYLNSAGQNAVKLSGTAKEGFNYPDLAAAFNGQSPLTDSNGALTLAVQNSLKQMGKANIESPEALFDMLFGSVSTKVRRLSERELQLFGFGDGFDFDSTLDNMGNSLGNLFGGDEEEDRQQRQRNEYRENRRDGYGTMDREGQRGQERYDRDYLSVNDRDTDRERDGRRGSGNRDRDRDNRRESKYRDRNDRGFLSSDPKQMESGSYEVDLSKLPVMNERPIGQSVAVASNLESIDQQEQFGKQSLQSSGVDTSNKQRDGLSNYQSSFNDSGSSLSDSGSPLNRAAEKRGLAAVQEMMRKEKKKHNLRMLGSWFDDMKAQASDALSQIDTDDEWRDQVASAGNRLADNLDSISSELRGDDLSSKLSGWLAEFRRSVNSRRRLQSESLGMNMAMNPMGNPLGNQMGMNPNAFSSLNPFGSASFLSPPPQVFGSLGNSFGQLTNPFVSGMQSFAQPFISSLSGAANRMVTVPGALNVAGLQNGLGALGMRRRRLEQLVDVLGPLNLPKIFQNALPVNVTDSVKPLPSGQEKRVETLKAIAAVLNGHKRRLEGVSSGQGVSSNMPLMGSNVATAIKEMNLQLEPNAQVLPTEATPSSILDLGKLDLSKLNLAGGLTGGLPQIGGTPQIGGGLPQMNLGDLSALDLGKLTGIDASKLTGLDLSKMAQLDLPGLAGLDLSKLQGLDLSKLGQMDLSALQGLDLSSLDVPKLGSLSGMDLSKLTSAIPQGINLQGLDLGNLMGLDLSKISHSEVRRLSELDLSKVKEVDNADLAKLANLDLSKFNFTEFMDHAKTPDAGQTRDLPLGSSGLKLGDLNLKDLGSLESLSKVDLSGLNNFDFSKLVDNAKITEISENLKNLDLSKLAELDLSKLSSIDLSSLKGLDLSNLNLDRIDASKIADLDFSKLADAFNNFDVSKLNNFDFSKLTQNNVRRLSSLDSLNGLNFTGLSSQDMHLLSQLPAATTGVADAAKIDGSNQANLASLGNLGNLASLASLGNSGSLPNVDLSSLAGLGNAQQLLDGADLNALAAPLAALSTMKPDDLSQLVEKLNGMKFELPPALPLNLNLANLDIGSLKVPDLLDISKTVFQINKTAEERRRRLSYDPSKPTTGTIQDKSVDGMPNLLADLTGVSAGTAPIPELGDSIPNFESLGQPSTHSENADLMGLGQMNLTSLASLSGLAVPTLGDLGGLNLADLSNLKLADIGAMDLGSLHNLNIGDLNTMSLDDIFKAPPTNPLDSLLAMGSASSAVQTPPLDLASLFASLQNNQTSDLAHLFSGSSTDLASGLGSNLVGSNLVGSHLVGSNLVGSNLVGSNPVGSNLVGSNLVGSNLGSGASSAKVPASLEEIATSLASSKGRRRLLALTSNEAKQRRLAMTDGKTPISLTEALYQIAQSKVPMNTLIADLKASNLDLDGIMSKAYDGTLTPDVFLTFLTASDVDLNKLAQDLASSGLDYNALLGGMKNAGISADQTLMNLKNLQWSKLIESLSRVDVDAVLQQLAATGVNVDAVLPMLPGIVSSGLLENTLGLFGAAKPATVSNHDFASILSLPKTDGATALGGSVGGATALGGSVVPGVSGATGVGATGAAPGSVPSAQVASASLVNSDQKDQLLKMTENSLQQLQLQNTLNALTNAKNQRRLTAAENEDVSASNSIAMPSAPAHAVLAGNATDVETLKPSRALIVSVKKIAKLEFRHVSLDKNEAVGNSDSDVVADAQSADGESGSSSNDDNHYIASTDYFEILKDIATPMMACWDVDTFAETEQDWPRFVVESARLHFRNVDPANAEEKTNEAQVSETSSVQSIDLLFPEAENMFQYYTPNWNRTQVSVKKQNRACTWVPMCSMREAVSSLSEDSKIVANLEITGSAVNMKDLRPTANILVRGIGAVGKWADVASSDGASASPSASTVAQMTMTMSETPIFALEIPRPTNGESSYAVVASADNKGPKFVFDEQAWNWIPKGSQSAFTHIMTQMMPLATRSDATNPGSNPTLDNLNSEQMNPEQMTPEDFEIWANNQFFNPKKNLPMEFDEFIFMPRLVLEAVSISNGQVRRIEKCLPVASMASLDALSPTPFGLAALDPLSATVMTLIDEINAGNFNGAPSTTAISMKSFIESVPVQSLSASQDGLKTLDLRPALINEYSHHSWNISAKLSSLNFFGTCLENEDCNLI